MPSYEVLVKAYCSVVVQDAENEDEALELAWENVNKGDFELDEVSIESELASEESLNQAVRLCNQVI